jgi:IPT/TIG domain
MPEVHLTADPAPPAARPVMMTDAYVELGEANLSCLAESVNIEAENNPITVTTFCGVKDFPGPVKWHFRVKLLQSFDVGATDDTLSAALDAYEADGTPVAFKVRPYKSQPIGPTNPSFEGTAIPQPYNLFGGDAGNPSEVDLDWIMEEPPTKNTTPTNGSSVTVASVTPNSGSVAGAEPVTIAGTNFQSGATVNIGGAPATNVVVGSATSITADTPAGAAGAADVEVTSGGTTATLAGGFTYA